MGKHESLAPVVELSGAVSLLGRFPALAGADLEVHAGEIVMLQGPNGAGKTTLLRLCAGLAPMSSGSGRILDFDLSKREGRVQARRSVGLLGHATSLYDDLTVEENLRFWLAANRSAGQDLQPIMKLLGLAGRLSSVPVARLSAGQRRRVALAIVVARRPALWLLDEPHAGLDAQGRDLLDTLVGQAVTQGATAIVVSHELERVSALATRVVEVSGGRIRELDAV